MQAIEGKVFQDVINFDIEIEYCSIVPFFFFLTIQEQGLSKE